MRRLFTPHDGATHPYIGASAACWALHAAALAGVEPDRKLLETSTVAPTRARAIRSHPEAGALLLDAYAAQHHGAPSPQAIRSVAVHLLVLHGVFARNVAPAHALWIRRQAIRHKGLYVWLTPPPTDEAYALRHCYPGVGVGEPQSFATYVGSVYVTWSMLHRAQLDAWFDAVTDSARSVAADE